MEKLRSKAGWPGRRTIEHHGCADKRSYRFFRFLTALLDAAWTPAHGVNVDILLRCHSSFAVSLLIGAALPVRNAALLVEMQRYW